MGIKKAELPERVQRYLVWSDHYEDGHEIPCKCSKIIDAFMNMDDISIAMFYVRHLTMNERIDMYDILKMYCCSEAILKIFDGILDLDFETHTYMQYTTADSIFLDGDHYMIMSQGMFDVAMRTVYFSLRQNNKWYDCWLYFDATGKRDRHRLFERQNFAHGQN